MRFPSAVINKFKAYSSPAFFATFVYSDALLRATSMASPLLLFCTKFQITRVTPTYLSTVRVRQHSETEIEKSFDKSFSNLIGLNEKNSSGVV